MKKAAKTIKDHGAGLIRWFDPKINNGILEGLNSLIQAAKRWNRGYRTIDNLIAMIYLVGSRLSLQTL